MLRVQFVVALVVLTTGCVTSDPLPPPETTESVVGYTDALVDSTTAKNLDQFIDPMYRGEESGYRWIRGDWCPRHVTVQTAADVRGEFQALCIARGGHMKRRWLCEDVEDPDLVFFAAKIDSPGRCRSGATRVALDVVEPTRTLDDTDYIAMLRRFGFETVAEIESREAQEAAHRRHTEETYARYREEEKRRAQAAKAAVLNSGVGTRICRAGLIDYVLPSAIGSQRRAPGRLIAQLDGFSEDKERLRFRVLGYEVPSLEQHEALYGQGHRMGDFLAYPGTVYWDRTDNWAICD